MSDSEQILFKIFNTLSTTLSGIIDAQAETNLLLADKLPDVADEARKALRDNSTELRSQAQGMRDAAKKLKDSLPK